MYQGLQCYPEYLIYYERVLEEKSSESKSNEDHAHIVSSSGLCSEAKVTETSEARHLLEQRERVAELREQSAQGQITLLEVENLNKWFDFKLMEQNRSIMKLRGLSDKPKTGLLGLTFAVPALERAFRIAHMRTCPCWLRSALHWRNILTRFTQLLLCCCCRRSWLLQPVVLFIFFRPGNNLLG